jgi:orotidine-5'-phosphate decarboxylase
MIEPKIFCAVDRDDLEKARNIVRALPAQGAGIKLGLEFFSALGAEGVESLLTEKPGAPVFMDLKFHDIPNTLARAAETVTTRLKPAYLNIHAAGGLEMMQAAKQACAPQTKLLGVTVLTSLDDDNLRQTGQSGPASAQVRRLALLAQEAGLDGVVCSSHEIESLRAACGPDFVLMVPGIRPAGAAAQDQKRIMTPAQAMERGATHLVIGRPITQAPDPAAALHAILEEIGS